MLTKTEKLVLVIAILASFVAFLDSSIVNVALPAIRRDLGGGLSLQQWVVDAYAITLGSLILIAGSLSDLFGRRKVLQWGLISFAVTSLLCSAAPNSLFLVIMRGLQGIAGALLVPSSLALIMSSLPTPHQGKAIGTWTAWTGIAFILGPLVGGSLVVLASWRWVFAVNIVPIALTLWLLRGLKSADQPQKRAKIDIVGTLLCALGLGSIVFGLIDQAGAGWHSPLVLTTLCGGIVVFAAFIAYEQAAKSPMLPLELFRVRNFGVGNLATAAIYAGLAVSSFLITVFIQQVGGYSAIQAGLALLPITLIMFLLSPRFGALASRYGPRFFMSFGPALGAVGFFMLLRVQSSINYPTQLLPGVLVFGLGLSITVAPLTAAILGSIESQKSGIASAINNAVSRVAGLLAVGAIGIVVGSKLNVQGFHRGVVTMAVLLLVGSIISGFGIQNVKVKKSHSIH